MQGALINYNYNLTFIIRRPSFDFKIVLNKGHWKKYN